MKQYTKGMTLVETLITMSLMVGVISIIFSLQTILTRQMSLDIKQNQNILEARAIISKMHVDYKNKRTLSGQDYKVSSFVQTDVSTNLMKRLKVSFILNNITYEVLFEELM